MATDTTQTPFLGMILPVPEQRLGPTYASDEVTAFNVIDAYAQAMASAGMSTSGIALSSSLEGNGKLLINVAGLQLQNVAILATGSQAVGSIQRSGSNFWLTPASGTPFMLSNGSQINVTAISGGIGGDYGLSLALESYNDTSKTFLFYQNSVNLTPAKLLSADHRFVPATAGAVIGTSLKAASGMLSNKDVTLWAGFPAVGTQVVTIDTTGKLSGSHNPWDLLEPYTGSRGALFKGTVRGNNGIEDCWGVTPGGGFVAIDFVATTAVTASQVSASSWVSTNEPDIRHSTIRVWNLHAAGAAPYSGSTFGLLQGSRLVLPVNDGDLSGYWESQTLGGSKETYTQDIPVQVGERLRFVRANVKDNGNIVRLKVWKVNGFGACVKLAEVNSGTGTADAALTGSVSSLCVPGSTFFAEVSVTGTNARYYGCDYGTTRNE